MDARIWMDGVTHGDSVLAVAQTVGMANRTLDGQLKSPGGLKPETAIRIARAYGHSPVAALVALGYLRADEASSTEGLAEATHLAWLRTADDDALLAEIGRRVKSRSTLGEPGER